MKKNYTVHSIFLMVSMLSAYKAKTVDLTFT